MLILSKTIIMSFFDTFFLLLTYLIKILLIFPIILYIIGIRSNLTSFRKKAFFMLVIGIVLAIFLTIFDFIK